jgi:dihydrofolate reductase
MIGPYRIVGYAIVSTDGMIADVNGVIPATLRNDADQGFLQTELDLADVVLHGRHSCEGGPRAKQRKRVIVTHRVPSVARDPSRQHVVLWNPSGASVEEAAIQLGVQNGTLAIIGGTEVFGLFLPDYDAFHMTRAARAQIPGGRPVFPQVDQHTTPEDLLSQRGLKPGRRRDIDPAAGITMTTWTR